MTRVLRVLGLAALAALLAAPFPLEAAGASERAPIYALGDIHGRLDLLRITLRGAGIIDDEDRWRAGAARLVLLGDLVDKGPQSRGVLDLLMRLEDEAERAGGRLHVLLGNHELMNLIGDLRFTDEAEFLAFADMERDKDREAAFRRLTRHTPLSAEQERAARAEFDARFPRGYFGHRRAYSRRGEYGRWLLEKDAMLVLEGSVFVHAGLSPATAELGAEALNRRVRQDLKRLLAAMETLAGASVIGPETPYSLVPRIAEKIAGRDVPADLPASMQRRVQSAALEVLELRGSPTLRLDGPLWYRGSALGEEIEEGPFLRGALANLGARRLVVGHTPTHTGRVMTRLGGRVIRVDTGRHEKGRAEALPILSLEASSTRVLYPGEEWVSLGGDDARPALAALNGSVSELESFLAQARVVSLRPVGEGTHAPLVVLLEHEGVTRRAVFRGAGGSAAAVKELAAYRLARLLDLTLVPPTTWREIEGSEGSLQLWVEGSIDERARRNEALPGSRDATIGDRLREAAVFDALIGIDDRDPENILFTPEDWKLWLIDHEEAFPASPGSPRRFENLRFPNRLAKAMTELDEESVSRSLGKLLRPSQIQTLLVRRDELLAGAR